MKNLFLSYFFLVICSSLSAQFAKERILTTDYISAPKLTITADFNKDGKKDIVSYSSDFQQLAISMQKTNLDSWKAATLLSRKIHLTHLTYGDIDGDDDLDIVCSSDENGTILVYRNINSTGAFSEPEILASGISKAMFVDLADYDGDGDLDFATASDSDDNVLWFQNMDSEGNFNEGTIVDTNIENPREVKSVDIDGDSDLDLVVAGRNDLRWYENTDGQGEFAAGIDFIAVGPWSSFFPVDFDIDGDQDILVGSFGDDQVTWYENENGTGNFSAPTFLFDYNQLYHIHAADLDQDQDVDIIIGSFININEIAIFENLGSNSLTFSDRHIILEDHIFSFDLNDMDGDNDLDLIVPTLTQNEIFVLENDLASQDSFIRHSMGNYTETAKKTLVVDLDKDGFDDFISVSNKLVWNRNTGNDNLSFEATAISHGVFEDCQVSDLDSDGDLDILYTANGVVRSLVNDNFRFTDQFIAKGDDFAVGDINGDGKPDVVSAYIGITWYNNISGLGIMDSAQVIQSADGGFLSFIELEDMDNDGDLDVIVGKLQQDPSVYWFENIDGEGTFAESISLAAYSELSNPTSITFGDIDGDSDTDIVLGDNGKNEIFVLKNLENSGNYAAPIQLTQEFDGGYGVELTDIDNDGDLDILDSKYNLGGIIWSENDGSGLFGERKFVLTDQIAAVHLASGDFDNDGDQDILSVLDGRGVDVSKISLFENLSIDFFIDLDNDGYSETQDCDDQDPCINPSALEIEGNGIDENCDGFDFQADPEDEDITELKVYPNPSTSKLHIELQEDEYESLHIFNSNGLKILEQSYNQDVEIDISKYDSGVYYIQFRTKDGMVTSRFLKI